MTRLIIVQRGTRRLVIETWTAIVWYSEAGKLRQWYKIVGGATISAPQLVERSKHNDN